MLEERGERLKESDVELGHSTSNRRYLKELHMFLCQTNGKGLVQLIRVLNAHSLPDPQTTVP